MFDRELLKKEYYSKLNLNGGELYLNSSFQKDFNKYYGYMSIVYKSFSIEVLRVPHLFKINNFKIKVWDHTKIYYNHFAGDYYKCHLEIIHIPKSHLLNELQKQIDFFHRRYIKLAAFT